MKKLLYLTFLFCISIHCFSQDDATERGLKIEKKAKGFSYKNKYALIIGINDYKDNKISKLKYATNDAKAISQLLMNKLGFDPKNVILLLDSMATRANILDTLQKRFINDENIEENSQLLIYFAGHGSTSKSGNKGFLLNYDAKEGSELSTAISMDDIGRIASECRSKHLLFLVDACYGGFANPRSGSGAFIKNVWNQKAREVITAGNSEEKVIESSTWQHSAFTKVLLDGVEKGEADVNHDNIISSSELHVYLEQRIAYYAAQKGGKQTPQLGKLTPDNGTFFLELKTGALEHLDDNTQMLNEDEIAEKLFSKLIITSNVKTARVYVDGREVGYLNDGKFEYGLRPGFYKIDLKLEKFETTSIETVIKPDTTVTINLPMESKMSMVAFKVEPNDAAVVFNNNLIGTGSFIAELPKGRHEVLIDKKGYKPEKTVVNLVQNETVLSFQIQKITSTIELYSIPLGAMVINNADTLGKTPFTLSLGYGQHNLIFSKKDYLPKQLSLDIKESGLQRHDVLLMEKPEVAVAKEVSKLRGRSVGKFFIYGALAAGSYYGYKALDSKISDIKNQPTATTKASDDLDLYKVGKFASLGLTGIFALSSTINLVKIFTFNKTKLMRKRIEENANISFSPLPNGGFLTARIKF
jgi:Caspase domain/PEGA domain